MKKFSIHLFGIASKPLRSSLLWLLALVGTASAQADQSLATKGKSASAALTFTIHIPLVLRVLENRHPEQITTGQDAAAEQHLLLVSSLRNGFCAELGLMWGNTADWQLKIIRASGSTGAWLETTPAGYKLCARKPGRYALTLQHHFNQQESLTDHRHGHGHKRGHEHSNGNDNDNDNNNSNENENENNRTQTQFERSLQWPVNLSLSSP